MSLPPPVLDHVVVDVRDRMDDAASRYRRLGFHLTERGHHTLGSINHLAIFDTNYLELLGFGADPSRIRADIQRFPVGLNGLVIGTDDSSAVHAELERLGMAAQAPVEFSRAVQLADGSRRDAIFRVVRLPPDTLPNARAYFCHHFTRDLVWRDEWRDHPNGAVTIARIVRVAPDPAQAAAFFARMFGADAVRREGSSATVALGGSRLVIMSPVELDREFGPAAPEADGRDDFMAAVTIRTRSLEQTARVLQKAGIEPVRLRPDHLLVRAAEAMNVTLEFVP